MEPEPKNTSHPRATEHKHNQQEHNHEQSRVNQGYTILEMKWSAIWSMSLHSYLLSQIPELQKMRSGPVAL